MSTALAIDASIPAHGTQAWVHALACEHVPPAGTRRVLVGEGGEGVAAPYLHARARVVGVGSLRADPRYHARLAADAHGLPAGRREADADLIALPLLPKLDAATLAAIGRALAPGGVAVLGIADPSVREEALARLAAEVELVLARWLRVDAPVDADGGAVAVVRDPRRPQALPPVLTGLDRTMGVDREHVLRALEREPWRGDGLGGDTMALLAALRRQLADGEPDLRALPWTHATTAATEEPPGVDVLVVMPHPDDESVYAAGTLAGLAAAGRRVALVVATDGAGGRGGADLGRRRAEELVQAAAHLGLRALRCLAWADFGKYRDEARTTPVTAGDALRRWGLERGLEALVAEIRRERPRVLLGLDPELDPNLSMHGHHLGLGVLLALAFHAAADPTYAPQHGAAWACDEHRVMAPQAHARWSEPLEIDREAKQRALRAHASQAYSTARLLEALDDPRRPAVELTRRVQTRRPTGWWLGRRPEARPERSSSDAAEIDWTREAERVLAHPRSHDARGRALLVEALRRQAEAHGHDPAVEASLRRLGSEHAVAVVTGQQVGLLGGPAYVLAKALSAVALARRLQRGGIEAVPVFWMASHDHDLAEAERVPRLESPPLHLGLRDTGAPVGDRRLGAGIDGLVDAWAAALPRDRATEVIELVRRTHRPDRSFTQAFAGLLRALTRGTGLLLLDPADPALARLARPLLQRAVEQASAVGRALAEARARLHARGEREVVPTGRERLQVFLLDEHGARRRPSRSDDLDAIAAALELHPERFSPAALLRPLVQDALLPTVAYVAGPTEARYLEQTHELYAWAELPRPRVVPRVRLVLAEARDVAALTEAGGVEALRADPRALERIGRAALTPAASTWLDELDAVVGRLDAERRRARAHAPIQPGPEPEPEPEPRLAPAALHEQLQRLDALAIAALPSLPRTARTWPHVRATLEQRAAEVLAATPVVPARVITRLRHALLGLRRSILRDGRRARPEAVAAWKRVASVPAPPERRITVAELVARGGLALPHELLAALEAEPSSVLELWLGGPR